MAMAKRLAVLATMIVFCAVFHCKTIDARQPTTYFVGGGYGWSLTIDIQSWARVKTFYAGDILVFKYDTQLLYDVVVVDKEGHDTCTAKDGDPQYDSGNDKIQLVFGPNYFICSVPEDCQAGMQLYINALAPPPAQRQSINNAS